MKRLITILSLISMLVFGSDLGVQLPKEDIQYRPPVQIDKTSKIISGREEAKKKTQTTFTYNRNNVYEVYAMPGYLTTFELNPDEEITFLAGGDTENWQLDEAKGGEKNTTFVFVKPIEEELETNILITTNKRLYNIKIESTSNEYNSLVKWEYPETAEMIKFRANTVETATTNADKINMYYTMDNKYYPFAPEKVYDDGNKTYFTMKKSMQEMPTLFIKGDDNKYSQTNYRIDDEGRFIVDRTARRFKFILGKKSVTVVNQRYK